MSIERSIHASLPRGIDNDENGYQFYSYTPNFKKLMEEDSIQNPNSTLQSFYRASYKQPKADEWLYNLPEGVDVRTLNPADYSIIMPKGVAACNEAALKAAKHFPYSFSYRSCMVAGEEKATFLFAKSIGIDWSGGRPNNEYHYSVTCDKSYVKKHPVFYCSSPAVCCDIDRSEFYRESGELPQPAFLSELTSLDEQNGVVDLRYRAGYDEITPEDIKEFLMEEDRIDILFSMLSALMQLKDGNQQRRIIIADEKSNIIMWIAAISYVFPMRNAMDISFSSYLYLPTDFDITGVFEPVMNNCFEAFKCTAYNYNAFSSSYAVYDFRQGQYAPEVSVDDSMFMDAVNNAFTMNLRIIDQYKDYISNHTNYTGIGSDYQDGYNLYAYMTSKSSKCDITKAIAFAEKYAVNAEKKALLDKLLSNSISFAKDSVVFEALKGYIKHCCDNGIDSNTRINQFFIETASESLFDESVDNPTFNTLCNICSQLCNISEKEFAALLASKNSISSLEGLVNNSNDAWRIVYVNYIICCAVHEGKYSLRLGSPESVLITASFKRLFESDTINDTSALKNLVNNCFGQLPSIQHKLKCADAVCTAFAEKGFNNCLKTIVYIVADLYMNGSKEERKALFEAMAEEKSTRFYCDSILMSIGKESHVLKLISSLQDFIDNGGTATREYTDKIVALSVKAMDGMSYASPKERIDIYYALFRFFNTCSEKLGARMKVEEIQHVYDEYITNLTDSTDSYILESDRIEQLREINNFVSLSGCKIDGMMTNVFVSLRTMKDDIKKKNSRSSCFSGHFSFDKVDIYMLPGGVDKKYVSAVGKLCGEYWVETDEVPMYEQLVNATMPQHQRDAMFEEMFACMIDYVLENTKRGAARCAADIVELSIIKGYNNLLDAMPQTLFESGVKASIIDCLEKDIKQKVELKKKSDNELLDMIDTVELQKRTDEIREYYEKNRKGILDGVTPKSLLGEFKSLFGKKN